MKKILNLFLVVNLFLVLPCRLIADVKAQETKTVDELIKELELEKKKRCELEELCMENFNSIESAGNSFLASTLLIIAGGVLSGIAGVSGNREVQQPLLYIGAGCGVIGFLYYLMVGLELSGMSYLPKGKKGN